MYQNDYHTKRLFGSDSTMGLFVALYLILLAFFILLNSVSSVENKKLEEAMDSVSATFKKEGSPKNKPQTNTNAEDVVTDNIALLNISRTFFAELDIKGRFSGPKGNVFEVEFPTDYLFEPGSMHVRRDMRPMITQLVSAVMLAPKNRRLEVAIMFGAGKGPVTKELSRPQELAIRRAGALARNFRENGIPDGTFSTGFVAVPEGTMLAVFHSVSPEIGAQ